MNVGVEAVSAQRSQMTQVIRALTGAFVLGQAIVLLAAGAATLWWSSDLMLLLIQSVGYEYALGPQNVIRLEDGGTLLTNPAAMIRWTTPFWFLGIVQMTTALTLVGLLWFHHPGGHDGNKNSEETSDR